MELITPTILVKAPLCGLVCQILGRDKNHRDAQFSEIAEIHSFIFDQPNRRKMVRNIVLSGIEPQRLSSSMEEPKIPRETYGSRLESVLGMMKEKGLDALAVYGDREHFGNLAYACGYDPRFEEALLIFPSQGQPAIMVGKRLRNEQSRNRLEP